MLVILSLFLIRIVLVPSVGATVRRLDRLRLRRRQLDALLRDAPVAAYRLD